MRLIKVSASQSSIKKAPFYTLMINFVKFQNTLAPNCLENKFNSCILIIIQKSFLQRFGKQSNEEMCGASKFLTARKMNRFIASLRRLFRLTSKSSIWLFKPMFQNGKHTYTK